MIRTLYLTRNGLLEPLGQSQVLAYIKGFSDEFIVTVISCEKVADLGDPEELSRIEAICADHGIRWIRLHYRRKPRVLAAAWNLGALLYHTWREGRRSEACLIHARSYIPAVAAWLVARMIGIPFIFDMRSLWPEELITSRRLRRGSVLHQMILWVERRLLVDADIVVSLTHAGLKYLEEAHPGSLSVDRLRVIPTCTDLDRFRPMPSEHHGGPLIGCHGSLTNGWFRIDLLVAMFDMLVQRLPSAQFEIITREDPAQVCVALDAGCSGAVSESWRSRLTISAAKPSEIHARLQRQDLSLLFYASGAASELGRSPTRMGEALGCGVPVVVNSGIGDVAEIVREGGVGVVLDGEDDATLARVADAAVAALRDPAIEARCRQVAERVYSLEAGVEKYRAIYRGLVAYGAATPQGLKPSRKEAE